LKRTLIIAVLHFSYDRDFNDAHVYRLLQKILHTLAMIGTLMMPMFTDEHYFRKYYIPRYLFLFSDQV
jgi:hypothetical protein